MPLSREAGRVVDANPRRRAFTGLHRYVHAIAPGVLPTFAWVTPTLCNDGHDCDDATVESWASVNVQRVLGSATYQAGKTAVFIWYDEDHPVPNTQIAPTSHKGQITQTGVGSHAALLKTFEDMLGLSILTQGQMASATDLRTLLGL